MKLVLAVFLIGASIWGWAVNQMPIQFVAGLLVGTIVTELYYWKVTKII